jgi:zinc protease
MSRADRTRLPALGAAPSFQFPAIVKDELPGGLSLWTVVEPSLPVATFVLVLPFGSAADPEDRHGLAALTGDMLDEGSGDRSALDVCAELARMGARMDTEVTADATILSMTALSEFTPRALWLLADCVARPRLQAEDFERVRHLRAARLVQLRDVPSAVADWAFMRLLYGPHPYGHLAIGGTAALQQMSADDVVRFHRAAYLPSGATLVAVGAVNPGKVRQIVADAFGSWAPPGERARARSGFEEAGRAPAPRQAGRRLAMIPKPGAAQSEIRLGHVALPRDTPDYHAVLVLNAVLGGQFVSRINLKLRQEKGYTYGARTAFDFRRGPGPFLLQAAVQTSVTADAIREAVGELWAIRGDRPPVAEELEMAKASLTRGYARNFETPDQLARAIVQLVLYGLPDDYFDRFVAIVDAVDAEAVRAAAVAHLDPDRMTTALVCDCEAVGQHLAGAGYGEPIVMAVEL